MWYYDSCKYSIALNYAIASISILIIVYSLIGNKLISS